MARGFAIGSFAVALGIAICALPQLARASATYPALIQAQLGLNYAPDCTICHRDDNGGIGTVIQPFGLALMSFGLRAEAPAALTSALDQAKADGLDSGGDGVPDIEELEADMNPNAGGGGRPAPQYGCALGQAGAPHRDGGAAAAFLFLAWVASWTCRRLRSQ
jgi:hypothetical protein